LERHEDEIFPLDPHNLMSIPVSIYGVNSTCLYSINLSQQP